MNELENPPIAHPLRWAMAGGEESKKGKNKVNQNKTKPDSKPRPKTKQPNQATMG